MKDRIIEIVELGQPQSLIQREKAHTTELIKTDLLIKELNEQLRIGAVSGMLPDEVPNLFVTLAQQIHYESVINGLDMTSIIEYFNELQEAYKKERSNCGYTML